ncbi:MAG: DNA repair protein RecO [Elusimicrobia bacterium RIFOXYD2_FULL_34_15]|nr:MAG: DNA repair protein RecO [Elusimicrobia bacterium RIFOXYD2_FULL_34_15]
MIFNTQAIIIRKMDYKDYDRILTLYTSDFGKIKLLAKSVRKPKAKLTQLTELFILCEFRIFLRESFSFGKLTGGVILDSNPLIRYDIEKFYEASYMCEVMDAMTPDRQPNIQKFYLLKDKLSLLNKNIMNQKDDFIEKLLHLTGFGVKKGVPLDKILQEHIKYPLKTESAIVR